MQIKINRNSVCMGDDCVSHEAEKEYPDNIFVSDFLKSLSSYLPSMKNVVWLITSNNALGNIIGYFLTDNLGNADIELNIDNTTLKDAFADNLSNAEIHCSYFHQKSFSSYDGETLLEKVKRSRIK
jgi:Ran GTPase-activating protein (RanGAP) involved in mRNA processing and transport